MRLWVTRTCANWPTSAPKQCAMRSSPLDRSAPTVCPLARPSSSPLKRRPPSKASPIASIFPCDKFHGSDLHSAHSEIVQIKLCSQIFWYKLIAFRRRLHDPTEKIRKPESNHH